MVSERRLPITERLGFNNKNVQLLNQYDAFIAQLQGTDNHGLLISGDVKNFGHTLEIKGQPQIFVPIPEINLLATWFLWTKMPSSFMENISDGVVLKEFHLEFKPNEVNIREGGIRKWEYLFYLAAKNGL